MSVTNKAGRESMADRSKFTATERRMLQVFSDGAPHTLEELHKCVSDDLSDMRAAFYHIQNLRKKLEVNNETLRTIRSSSNVLYQHVRFAPINRR